MEGYKAVVHDRDKICCCCGTKGSKGNPLTVHHIIPKCKGGRNTPENCQLLCQTCHRDLHQQNGYPTRSKKIRSKKRRRR